MPRSARHRQDAGLTLVELMITLVVAALVSVSTYVFFVGQQRLYDTQIKLVNAEQNITAAMEMMSHYVRAAGAGMQGCVPPAIATDPSGGPPPVSASNSLASAPATGLRAYLDPAAACATCPPASGLVRIPPLWIVDGAAGGPDTITVAFGNGTFGTWVDAGLATGIGTDATQPVSAGTAALASQFRASEFVVLFQVAASLTTAPWYSDRGCTLFQITSVDTTTLNHASTSPWNPPANVAGLIPYGYSDGTPAAPALPTAGTGIRHFGTLNWVRFAIRPGTHTTACLTGTDSSGCVPPALTMERLDQGGAAEVLADGIEDLQIAYACDSNGDGNLPDGADAAARTSDEWLLNASGETAPPVTCYRPAAVRLTLMARSLTPDGLLTSPASNSKRAVENGAAGPSDWYRHGVLTTTVFPRNLLGAL
jgi:prepilin-type N-terminal cleavage/methylation domain-containing protein